MQSAPARPRFGPNATAAAAAVGYALAGLLWIAIWDAYLARAPLLTSASGIAGFASVREWLSVGAASVGVFFIVRLALRRLSGGKAGDAEPAAAASASDRVVAIAFAVLALTVAASGTVNYLGFRDSVVAGERREVASVVLLKR